jgi:hypothetical protein
LGDYHILTCNAVVERWHLRKSSIGGFRGGKGKGFTTEGTGVTG